MKWVLFVLALTVVACAPEPHSETIPMNTPPQVPPNPDETSLATFAGGCFWCMEPPFEKLDGVISVTSGYAGGEEENPTYKEVSSGETGHRESVQIVYDPAVINYKELLNVFWRQIDPTDADGSFVDRGFQYSSAIFTHTEEQRVLAEASLQRVEERIGKKPVTVIEPFTTFYPAEDYHQDYYKENPLRYKYYRGGSGRDMYIEQHWFKDNTSIWEESMVFRKPSQEELQKTLTPIQYEVTQKEGTEPAFENEYWNNTQEGIYVDIVSGEPLFSSTHKYKSGTGWPSFSQPLEPENIVTKKDFKLILPRTEVKSRQGDSHLGHVFNDGPEPTGKRYCMNSAALRFIPKEKLEEEGYEKYLSLFE